MSDLVTKPAVELARLIAARKLGAVELTRAFLDRIERLNPILNAFITVTGEQALGDARKLDRSRGRRGPLHGVPLGLKDLFATKGVRTTAGSKILQNWIPDYDATTVERCRAAGAVVLGKLNLHELAYGVTSNNPHYGAVRNPWNRACIAGGSSGGSGAAVAASLCSAALGTDTGGSIRIPAAACGVVGLKPTYGRVSRHGVVPLSWSLDHVGPLTKTVADAALMLAVLAGRDPRDATSSAERVPNYRTALRQSPKGLRVGIPHEQFFDLLADDVRAAFDTAVAVLKRLGVRAVSVSLPAIPHSLAAEFAIMGAEAGAVHARALSERPDDFGADVRGLLQLGRLVPATAFIAAQRMRAKIINQCREALRRVDAFVVPSLCVGAPRIDEPTVTLGGHTVDAAMLLSRTMMPFNLTGLPAISVPCGRTESGMPIGLQIAGRHFDEATILRIAHAYEQATEWHTAQPPL